MATTLSNNITSEVNIEVKRGQRWARQFKFKKPDLSYYDIESVDAQVRTNADDLKVIIDKTTEGDSPNISLAVEKEFLLEFTESDTQKMKAGTYVYDVEVKLAGIDKATLIGGTFIIKPDVTRR